MTAPQPVAVADISVDRRFLRAMIEALGGDARARPEHDAPRVRRYVHALKRGATFPPIVVVQSDRKLFLLDGAHRLRAHRAVGRATIEAIVLSEGSFRALLPKAAITRLPGGVSVSLAIPQAAPSGRVFKFCRWLIEGLRRGRKE